MSDINELRAALRAQIEVTTMLARRLEFTHQDIADFTSQARRALASDPEFTPCQGCSDSDCHGRGFCVYPAGKAV